MSRVSGFPPVVGRAPRILILGSMPGRASLAAQQYYAQPQNVFWRIMGSLLGAGVDLPYARRLQVLRSRGVALWDVLESCVRSGSLDASIDQRTAKPNELVRLLREHRTIRHVYFNGATAQAMFERRVRPEADRVVPGVVYQRLPSTSPVHAAMPFAEKRERWSVILAPLRRRPARGDG